MIYEIKISFIPFINFFPLKSDSVYRTKFIDTEFSENFARISEEGLKVDFFDMDQMEKSGLKSNQAHF